MTKHLKAYCKYHLCEPEEVVCEITGRPGILGGVDISHNKGRGMGGSKERDTKWNLMALDRRFHDFLEHNPSYLWWFQLVHSSFIAWYKPYMELLEEHGITDPVFEEIKAKL